VSAHAHSVAHGTIDDTRRLPRVPRPAVLVATAAALACLALLVAEVASGWNVLHSTEFFTAQPAHKYVWANAAVAVIVALTAVIAPGRWRLLAILGPALFLAAVLVATAIPGGAFLAMLTALFAMTSLWDTGERLLRRLGASELAENALVAWLAGIAPWSLAIVLLGRISLVKWWTVGIALLAIGAIGCYRLGGRLLARRQAIERAVIGTRLAAVSAGLSVLMCGWAAIYTAAPEIQYDALYGKAFLPEFWARTGHIASIVQHVQDAITGWFQILATSGHLFGATAVGRYMQLIGLVCLITAVWWWGSRYGAFGPIAALAVGVTPHLFWQASTADDDLLLALAGLAFCIAIVQALRADEAPNVRGLAFALGLMAGTGPSLKLHLLPLFAVLLLGWIVAGRASKTIVARLCFGALGAAITALPPLILRWIDTGNPVLPAYNNVFKSKYWLPINEKLNFPFWMHPGSFGPLRAIWKAVTEPSLMVEDAPAGAFGVLVGAVVIALLLGWLGGRRVRGARVVWIALIPAAIFWWVSFRYLRYLLAIELVSVALLLMLTGGVRIHWRGRAVAIVAMTLFAIAAFPVAIAQFWNVPAHKPPVYAAIGRWRAASYEDAQFPERQAILAFNRLSPHGARMASDAFQRVWLTGERDLYNLHYEVVPLIQLQGIEPTTGNLSYEGLKRLGIDWLMVDESDRLQHQQNFISEAITAHGKPEFDSRGWDLYRLVPKPPVPKPLSACDRKSLVGICWSVAPTKALTVSVTRAIPSCPGEQLAVSVRQAPGGTPAPVLVTFVGGTPQEATQPGGTVPGEQQTIYATAPAGTTSATVTISPNAATPIQAASIATIGRACAGARSR
jgi:hypothetical protein